MKRYMGVAWRSGLRVFVVGGPFPSYEPMPYHGSSEFPWTERGRRSLADVLCVDAGLGPERGRALYENLIRDLPVQDFTITQEQIEEVTNETAARSLSRCGT